jgi:hypothetical protein
MTQGDRSKGVHVKLDKETHSNFKTRLIQHGVSMQEAFEEFARLVGTGSLSANRMLETLVRTRVKAELATVGLKPMGRKRKPRFLGELDQDKLYDLINEGEEDEAEVSPDGGGRDEIA